MSESCPKCNAPPYGAGWTCGSFKWGDGIRRSDTCAWREEAEELRTALAAATKRAEEAEAKLAQSTNYVADDDTYPTCVWFANGRVVSVNAAGVLEIRFGKQLEACDE